MLTVQTLKDGWDAGWVEHPEDGMWWLAAEHKGVDISDLESAPVGEAQDALQALIESELSRAMTPAHTPRWREHTSDLDGARFVSFADGSTIRLRKGRGGDLMKVRGRHLFDRELGVTERITGVKQSEILGWQVADYLNVQNALQDFLEG